MEPNFIYEAVKKELSHPLVGVAASAGDRREERLRDFLFLKASSLSLLFFFSIFSIFLRSFTPGKDIDVCRILIMLINERIAWHKDLI